MWWVQGAPWRGCERVGVHAYGMQGGGPREGWGPRDGRGPRVWLVCVLLGRDVCVLVGLSPPGGWTL